MAIQHEQDFPPGHPARFDYYPDSPEAKEWRRQHVHLKGERDFPVDHPKAVDTPGNTNHVPVLPGVDPHHPEMEAFTGRSPEDAARHREIVAELVRQAQETPAVHATVAPEPPPPGSIQLPSGQPGG